MPLISVVMPTYQRPNLCLRAVRSVLAQTFGDIEVVVVLDGPNAETRTLLERLDDPRLKMVQNETAAGGGAARNAGVAAASGAWIAFIDDDDEWMPSKLERQLAVAGSVNRPVFVTCLSHIITPGACFVWPRHIYDSKQPFDEYLFDRRTFFKGESFCQTSSFLMPRWLFERVRFPLNHLHEDWELTIKMVKREGAEVVTVPEPLVLHYIEEQRAALSSHVNWRASIAWIDSLGATITPRAYSAFCLIMTSSIAAGTGEVAAIPVLFKRALTRGAPTAVQLALFLMPWLLPMRLRHVVRNALHGRPGKDAPIAEPVPSYVDSVNIARGEQTMPAPPAAAPDLHQKPEKTA